MSNLSRKLMMGAAGAAGGGEYIEDIFSTWLYDGNGSTQTITNGIDLAGEGGLVWIKHRSSGTISVANHYLSDTERGRSSYLHSSTTGAAQTAGSTAGITSFNAGGFSLGTDIGGATNYGAGTTYASWTFRKAPGFFDVVTYTGNGINGRTIPHSLGSTPGFIIIKRIDAAAQWICWHRSTGSAHLVLNSTEAAGTSYNNYFTADASNITINTSASTTNDNGGTYVAYLFAHDEQIFGDAGDQSVIKCGSYTGTGAAGNFISLGWEPQFLITKRADTDGAWHLMDIMRGMPRSAPGTARLFADTSAAEVSGGGSDQQYAVPSPNGFTIESVSTATNASGSTYIYIAIRRGPMKTPTSGTEVFNVDATASSTSPAFSANFPADFVFEKEPDTAANWYSGSRLTGSKILSFNTTGAEGTGSAVQWDYMNGAWDGFSGSWQGWLFRRAPGFFDAVAYTGTGSARTVAHNLGVAPELMIFKNRGSTDNWACYHSALGATAGIWLNLSNASFTASTLFNDTLPASSVFTVGSAGSTNSNTFGMIAYLFATLPGISKVGSYTGTGTTLNVDCGFTTGARFVLIKRTDSTGDWYVWDTARGIVAANDPYLLLNSTAAEVTSTDYIDPLSSGFQISSTAPAAINASGGSFIFLAIA